MRTSTLPKFTAGAVDLRDGIVFRTHSDVWQALRSGLALPVIDDPAAKALKGDVAIRLQLGVSGQAGAFLSRDTVRMPNATRALFTWFRAAWPQALATHLTISFNRLAPLHTDELNRGSSYFTAIGDFEGGGLWVMDPSSPEGAGKVLQVDAGQWHAFSPHHPHRTLPFSGERAYVTFYCHSVSRYIDEELRKKLLALSIPCPTPLQLQPMLPANPVPRKQRMTLACQQFARHPQQASIQAGAHRPRSYICRNCYAFGRDEDRGQPRKFCKATYHSCRKSWRRSQEIKTVRQRVLKRPAGR